MDGGLRRRWTRLRRAGRQRVHERYTWDRVARDTAAIYGRLAETAR
ncbi:hypothetical protein ACTWP6_20785 [Mycobacterium sp. 4D054]|nr:hypothetical protein [Mycobacterium sp. SMC-8]UXA10815.1 hypothetical protein KXD97_22455 [Mycobacterium sp. SMC-8]